MASPKEAIPKQLLFPWFYLTGTSCCIFILKQNLHTKSINFIISFIAFLPNTDTYIHRHTHTDTHTLSYRKSYGSQAGYGHSSVDILQQQLFSQSWKAWSLLTEEFLNVQRLCGAGKYV